MKSSKHVETCFVRANDDFDDKLTYTYCFLNKKNYWTKMPKNGHCDIIIARRMNFGHPLRRTANIYLTLVLVFKYHFPCSIHT